MKCTLRCLTPNCDPFCILFFLNILIQKKCLIIYPLLHLGSTIELFCHISVSSFSFSQSLKSKVQTSWQFTSYILQHVKNGNILGPAKNFVFFNRRECFCFYWRLRWHMTIHKMASEVGGRREKMNWGGKEKPPGRSKSWLVPLQLDLGEEVSTSEQLGWISSFNPW